jgi:RND superfamily putative drug exporter
MPMDSNVPTVVTVLGLGLSIDYGLLYVSRFRQERVVRGSAIAAAHASAHPATHTVVFSGVVVASSLAALFIFDSPLYRAMAAGGIAVTLVSLLTSVTLTPALLRILGSKMRVRGTALHRRRRMPLLSLARGVARHPWIVLVLVTGALAVAATPALDITLRDSRAKGLPDSFSSRHVAETLQERFDGGDTIPIIVLSRGSLEELNTYTEALRLRTDVRAVTSPVKLPNGFWSLVVTPTDTGTGAAAQGVVRAIRADPLVFDMIVAGPAAITTDFMDMMKSKASLVFAAIAFSTFVLLAFMSGSVVIPLKALLMNILSLTASFGVIVLVFQEGRLHDFTGVEAVGSIEPWIPMLIFVFTFALSMDYEVFLISAIKEMRDRGMPNGEAIAHGVHRSGKLVTSAALLMILVFMGFAMGESVQIKELGAAMGLAVFIDATLVRCLLLPASMALLGEANWWAPRRRKGAAMGTKPQPVAPPFSRSVPRFSHLRTNEQFRLVAPETVLPRRRYPAIPSISQNLTSATPEFLNGHPGQG